MPSAPAPSPSSPQPPQPSAAPAESNFQNLGPLEAPEGYVSPEVEEADPSSPADPPQDGSNVPTFAHTLPDDPSLTADPVAASKFDADEDGVPPAKVEAKAAPAKVEATVEPEGEDTKTEAKTEAEPEKVEAKASAELPTTFDPASWTTIEDIKDESVPDAVRPYITRFRELSDQRAQAVEEAARNYRADLDAVLEQLKAGGAAGLGDRANFVLDTLQANRELVRANTTMLWEAFKAKNPGYAELPEAARATFSAMLTKGALGIFPGTSEVDKLGAIYQYVCAQHGIVAPAPGSGALPTIVVTPEPVPAAPPVPVKGNPAAAQALVTDGRSAVREHPKPRIADTTTRDILKQHEHLLG